MKIRFLVYFFTILFLPLKAQPPVYEDWFDDQSMRVDFLLAGDHEETHVFLHDIHHESGWAGSRKNLLFPFYYGKYFMVIRDSATEKEIFSQGFNTLFGEWQTTMEAQRTKRSFEQSFVFPRPISPFLIELYKRESMDQSNLLFQSYIAPSSYLIENRRPVAYETAEIQISGDPSSHVDLVYIAEGYTQKEQEVFLQDVKRFNAYLFRMQPYSERMEDFNVRVVMPFSEDSGPDIPGEDIWNKTILDASFYTFGSERYLTSSSYWKIRDVASSVPYDHIIVLVNSPKYGGGGIFNHYSVFSSGHQNSPEVFVHELGHGFAGLGDEYYSSSVAYSEFYKLDKEPLVPNLTTLVDFDSKWKDMLDQDIPVPTPANAEYAGKTGVFEGGGYSAKGIYRPANNCRMKSNTAEGFCPVCREAIGKMIDYYLE